MSDHPMTVLVAVDGSAQATNAVAATSTLPLPAGTRMVVLTVIEDILRAMAGLGANERAALEAVATEAEQDAASLLNTAAAALTARGYNVETEYRRGDAAGEILAAADEFDVDLIVVGSHGWGGIRRFLIGSISDQVFRSASQSVCIVRGQEFASRDAAHAWRLLVAYDGSGPADRAVELCARLQLDESDIVELLTIVPVVSAFRQDLNLQLAPLLRQERDTAESEIAAAAERLAASGAEIVTRVIDADDVSEAILNESQAFAADLVLLGHRGRGLLDRFVTGSVAARIAHHAEQSVLSIR